MAGLIANRILLTRSWAFFQTTNWLADSYFVIEKVKGLIVVMNKLTRLSLVFFLLFVLASKVHATETITSDVYFSRAGMKIMSGAANIAFGWLELPKNLSIWSEKGSINPLVGYAEGLLWGVYHTAARTASGAVDLATFWLPTYPTPDPPFVFDNFSKQSDYYGFRMAR